MIGTLKSTFVSLKWLFAVLMLALISWSDGDLLPHALGAARQRLRSKRRWGPASAA